MGFVYIVGTARRQPLDKICSPLLDHPLLCSSLQWTTYIDAQRLIYVASTRNFWWLCKDIYPKPYRFAPILYSKASQSVERAIVGIGDSEGYLFLVKQISHTWLQIDTLPPFSPLLFFFGNFLFTLTTSTKVPNKALWHYPSSFLFFLTRVLRSWSFSIDSRCILVETVWPFLYLRPLWYLVSCWHNCSSSYVDLFRVSRLRFIATLDKLLFF